MKKRAVLSFLGKIAFVEALLLLIPLFVSILYREGWVLYSSYIGAIFILLVIRFLLQEFDDEDMAYSVKEGLAIAGFSWFFLSFFGGLPFVFSGQISSVLDATFEMASGFTTTGASILHNVENISHSLLFWRSFTQFIGGLGILVFAFALAPNLGQGSVNIMRAEVPGPEFGKLSSKNKDSAIMLYVLYIIMTLIIILLLLVSGMNLFDAFIHGFATAGTGGFSNKGLGLQFYENPWVEYIMAFGMIAFTVNFNLYFLLFKRRVKKFLANEELRLFFRIILVCTLVIMINISQYYDNVEHLFRDAFFTVSSMISTTGYAVSDFASWPLFSRMVLVGIMFTGGMAGSTAGGLKLSRILIYKKTFKRELISKIEPRLVQPITVDGKPLSRDYVKKVFTFLGLYVGVFLIGTLLLSLSEQDFVNAINTVTMTLNNIGPDLGPHANFSSYNSFSKALLIIIMIAGRLELYPVLVLFSPRLWKAPNKHRKRFDRTSK